MNDNLAYVGIDCDFGTVRAWQVGVDGSVLTRAEVKCETDGLSLKAFEGVLEALVGEALPEGKVTPVICTGAIGGEQPESGYQPVPCRAPDVSQAYRADVSDARIALWLVPGVKQQRPEDVMGQEALQIAAFLSQHPKFDGVVCLPGPHSKWVRISAEEIVSFQTYLTGEMVDLLSQRSALRRAVQSPDVDKTEFLDAISEAMSRPQSVAAKLFGLRASHLLSNQSLTQGKSRLLGHLIGMELAGARPYWLGMDIAVIGAGPAGLVYADALEAQGCFPKQYDGEALALAGLHQLFEGLSRPA